MEGNVNPKFKITFVGQSQSGKTCLLKHLLEPQENFSQAYSATIGAEFSLFNDRTRGRIMQFWDTAGQERYRSLAPMYMRASDVIVIVFDVTSRDSYLVVDSFKELAQVAPEAILLLVGSKIDEDVSRVIGLDEAETYAKDNRMMYLDHSSKKGDPKVILSKLNECIDKLELNK